MKLRTLWRLQTNHVEHDIMPNYYYHVKMCT